jgi:hypothetical protein
VLECWRLNDSVHPLLRRRGEARGGAFRVSLLPRLIRWFYGCVAMGGSRGGDISVEFSVVIESNKFFACDAMMGKIPTVEMAVAVRFSRSGDGW